MTGKVLTPADIMAELQAMRTDLRRVLERSEDHEKRLAGVEALRASYRELITCNDMVIRELNQLKEDQGQLIETVVTHVERALRGDLFELRRELRTEMSKITSSTTDLTTAHKELSKILRDRPCVVNGDDNCVIEKKG